MIYNFCSAIHTLQVEKSKLEKLHFLTSKRNFKKITVCPEFSKMPTFKASLLVKVHINPYKLLSNLVCPMGPNYQHNSSKSKFEKPKNLNKKVPSGHLIDDWCGCTGYFMASLSKAKGIDKHNSGCFDHSFSCSVQRSFVRHSPYKSRSRIGSVPKRTIQIT